METVDAEPPVGSIGDADTENCGVVEEMGPEEHCRMEEELDWRKKQEEKLAEQERLDEELERIAELAAERKLLRLRQQKDEAARQVVEKMRAEQAKLDEEERMAKNSDNEWRGWEDSLSREEPTLQEMMDPIEEGFTVTANNAGGHRPSSAHKKQKGKRKGLKEDLTAFRKSAAEHPWDYILGS